MGCWGDVSGRRENERIEKTLSSGQDLSYFVVIEFTHLLPWHLSPPPPALICLGLLKSELRVFKLSWILFMFIHIWSERTRQMLKGPILVTEFSHSVLGTDLEPRRYPTMFSKDLWLRSLQGTWACSQPLCSSCFQRWSSYMHFVHSGGTRRELNSIELHCLLTSADPALLGHLKIES